MFYLSIRQLLSRPKQTTLILLGITFGALIYVLIAGIQLGMREYYFKQLLNNTPHITISADERLIDSKDIRKRFFSEDVFIKWLIPPRGKREEARLENYLGWQERLNANPQVLAFNPVLSIKAILTKRDNKKSLTLRGVEPDKQIHVTKIVDYVKQGELLDLKGGGDKIILGSGVFEDLGLRLYDTVRISNGVDEARPFKVVGMFEMGNNAFDDTMALANLKDVQQLNRTPGRISKIQVDLHDVEESKRLANRWELLTKDNVENWEEINASFMQMIKIQDISRSIIMVSILIVAGFGIYNVLSIMIGQKKKEIAILRSIGFSSYHILELFMIQGIILGFLGAILGMVFGTLFNMYIGSIKLGFKIGTLDHFIISYDSSIYFVAFGASMLAAILASFLPSFHASRLTPIDIIREE